MSSSPDSTPETRGNLSSRPWFAEWFDHPLYLEVYSHRDSAEAARCINTIIERTQPGNHRPSSINVLDIACGAGRHAIEFARLGYCVTGNDLSPYLLDTARKEAHSCNAELSFTCCDMRHLPAENSYDLIVQLFTSFGYFDSEEDDRRVIRNVSNLLNRNGWYVLDLINPLYLRRNLVPVSLRTVSGLDVREERTLEQNRITKKITIMPPVGEALQFVESVRLYTKEEITTMLAETDLKLDFIAGDYTGAPFNSEHSPRMMLFLRKS
ncbi:MAG: class I SAM-dependent methyltransferase [Chlorobium sp.]|uniref:class I SAM-dependent methyltransferase n=1 Tax=Chlorobium sp. TaxID=1095 RepID=UPI0025BB915D|nr:class I SAM-dependent methyltransferase [Chlorobium sp.]MCF8217150.1 class I SAM-dependent methyltransferase [Chlorobium sp.]MCF8272005.1 class I SAM-dependent methyltransferase [Chlorobium sp.]MCF8288368.1 class I SAM-dependent methyltransferase [Chlorobium sp.]MCF8291967.1 class I SAM-dependent methyltransferase [Chlorobium sp.]MCF8386067.1 class I SAM-dependent methyltransferase [Chlorobium sp.]